MIDISLMCFFVLTKNFRCPEAMLNSSRHFVFDVVLQSVVGEQFKGFQKIGGGVRRGGRSNSKMYNICLFFSKICAQMWCLSMVSEHVILELRLRIPVWRACRPVVNVFLVLIF